MEVIVHDLKMPKAFRIFNRVEYTSATHDFTMGTIPIRMHKRIFAIGKATPSSTHAFSPTFHPNGDQALIMINISRCSKNWLMFE